PDLRWRLLRAFDDGSAAVAVPEPNPAALVVPTTVAASDSSDAAARAWAGASAWRSARAEGWIAGEWGAPRPGGRGDRLSDGIPGFTPQGIVIEGRAQPGAPWRRQRTWALRPRTVGAQVPPHGQVFAIDPPAALAGVRLVGRGSAAWGVSGVRVLA